MLLDLVSLHSKYNMNIKGVVHIGAHYGEEENIYNQLGITDVAYIEPLTRNFDILKERVANKQALFFNTALGNTVGEVDMFVELANQSQSSSILEPEIHLAQYPHITFNHKETVSITKLDLLGLDSIKYNLINIDVQGYELEVFKGGTKFLENVDYIISEINRAEVYKGCAKIDELKDFLGGFGFNLVEESWAGGTWGDGLFIKTN
jgi:FkbM family methyltransferase